MAAFHNVVGGWRMSNMSFLSSNHDKIHLTSKPKPIVSPDHRPSGFANIIFEEAELKRNVNVSRFEKRNTLPIGWVLLLSQNLHHVHTVTWVPITHDKKGTWCMHAFNGPLNISLSLPSNHISLIKQTVVAHCRSSKTRREVSPVNEICSAAFFASEREKYTSPFFGPIFICKSLTSLDGRSQRRRLLYAFLFTREITNTHTLTRPSLSRPFYSS